MKILIADKSKSIRLRLGFLLSDYENIEIVEAESGEEVLQILRAEEPPQIALIAWMINGQNGIEVCERVRSEDFGGGKKNCPVYIIMMSSKSDEKDVVCALNAGADDYIQKPWSDLEFKARIDVARRTVEFQSKLIKQYVEMDNKLRRIEALGVKARGRKRLSLMDYANGGNGDSKQISLVSAQDGIISIRDHLTRAFTKLGCGEVLASNWNGVHPKKDYHVVWAATILDDVDMWMDYLVKIDQPSLEFIHENSEKPKNQNRPYLKDTLKEIALTAQNEINSALSKHSLSSWSVGTPVILTSHVLDLPPINLEYAEQIQLKVGKADIFVTVMDEESPVREVSTRELEIHQILVKDFYSRSNRETPLFRKGTSIDQSHLNMLFDLGWDPDSFLYLTIMKPSALGKLAQIVLSISDGES